MEAVQEHDKIAAPQRAIGQEVGHWSRDLAERFRL
jgi:hypothetical protein